MNVFLDRVFLNKVWGIVQLRYLQSVDIVHCSPDVFG